MKHYCCTVLTSREGHNGVDLGADATACKGSTRRQIRCNAIAEYDRVSLRRLVKK